jgi:SAM-dependent methyltransferase
MSATATATATAAETATATTTATATVKANPTSAKPEWFASWFDSEHYHRLYAHRDEREAGRFIDKLIARLRPAAGADVLDLGCGSGRHATRLASHGLRVTGLDLSAESLALARQRARARVEAESAPESRLRFVRQDMRQPFGDQAFDHVFSLFTSFGYFADPADHLTVIRNMAASLRAGGSLVLDYLNVRHAERHLTADEIIRRDKITYRIKRWSDTEAFYKRVIIGAAAAPGAVEHVERVAKLTLEDFRFMFALSGLRVEEIYGDYQLSPFDAETSPRLIMLARRAA